MRYYELQIKATAFINAEDKEKCEAYLMELIKDSGIFNVEAAAKETVNYVEYMTANNPVHETYEVKWEKE
jgi:hypothetical protein